MGGENKNGPKRRQTRLWGPGTFVFKYKYYLFIVFITTTACAHDTLANAIPLACKYEPGVGFSSPTSNQHHTHPPRLQTRAEGGFTHHHHHPTFLACKREPKVGLLSPPPLPSHRPQTSFKCSSGLSLYLALLLDLPCLHISTALAFASTSDELQALVWALRQSCPSPRPPLPSHSAQTSYKCLSGLSIHLATSPQPPCLRIKLRRVDTSALGLA
jgi:hypothetical protein